MLSLYFSTSGLKSRFVFGCTIGPTIQMLLSKNISSAQVLEKVLIDQHFSRVPFRGSVIKRSEKISCKPPNLMSQCHLVSYVRHIPMILNTFSSRNSGMSRLFTFAALLMSCLASSVLPRLRSHLADSGMNLVEKRK